MERQSKGFFRYARRGSSLVRTLGISTAILLAVAGAHHLAATWLVESTIQNVKESIAELEAEGVFDSDLAMNEEFLEAIAASQGLDVTEQDEEDYEDVQEGDVVFDVDDE